MKSWPQFRSAKGVVRLPAGRGRTEPDCAFEELHSVTTVEPFFGRTWHRFPAPVVQDEDAVWSHRE